jgi:two-component system sensor histidine kinase AlgZ
MNSILADSQRLRLHMLAWMLVGVMLGLLVQALLETSLTTSLVFAIPLGVVAAPISLSAGYVCRAIPLARTGPVRLAMTAVAAAVVTASFWAVLGQFWWDAISRLGFDVPVASQTRLFALLIGLGGLSYLVAVTAYYAMQALEESMSAGRRALEAQVAERDAELRALRAQVDPHFLFNSLNSVAGLIGSDPDKARQMCQRLGDFLRESLSVGRVPRIGLGREVALARQYLEVEQVRFGRRLTVSAEIGHDAADVPVPPLILQPLVENAVRHGIATLIEGGSIGIEARRAGQHAIVVVTNPCDPDRKTRGTGFGLDIVRRRLEAGFSGRAAMVVDAGAESYRVSVTLPIEGRT